jgi:hypothetical protein
VRSGTGICPHGEGDPGLMVGGSGHCEGRASGWCPGCEGRKEIDDHKAATDILAETHARGQITEIVHAARPAKSVHSVRLSIHSGHR